MSQKYVTTKNEFRHIFSQVCGSTEQLVDQQTAYRVMSCCGKTVIQSHLSSEWPEHAELISVNKLFEIFKKLDDLCIDTDELAKIGRRELTIEDIMESIMDSDIMNKEAVQQCLMNYIKNDGTIDLEKFVVATQSVKEQISRRFMGSSDDDFSPLLMSPSNTNSEEIEQISEIYPKQTSNPNEHVEDELHGEFLPLAIKARGVLSISPTLQSISFNILLDEPTGCEIVLSLAPNSDVPPGHFDNDLFLLIHDSDGRIEGITQFLLSNEKYSSGSIKVSNESEIMVVGMGTSFNRRKSTRDRISLVDENGKLCKRFKITLMNIFESFDVNQNGVLERDELNFYTLASGDASLSDEEWALYMNNFDNRNGGLTLEGFLNLHQVEASDKGEHVVADLWHSLNSLGYDSELQSIYGCSYDVSVYSTEKVTLVPKFHFVARKDRVFILEKLYELGQEQLNTELKYRIFQTDYFGLIIAKKTDQDLKKRYRLKIIEATNVRWNFPHRKDEEIYLEDSDSEWVLLASFTTKSKDYSLQVDFVEVT